MDALQADKLMIKQQSLLPDGPTEGRAGACLPMGQKRPETVGLVLLIEAGAA